jgi:four helix bundle protein
MHNFRKLDVWHRARAFGNDILRLTCRAKPDEKIVTTQLRKCGKAIAAQIAEGCGKRTRPETIRYLDMACASCGEAESHLEDAKDLGIIPLRQCHRLISEAAQLQRMTHALIRNLPEDQDDD